MTRVDVLWGNRVHFTVGMIELHSGECLTAVLNPLKSDSIAAVFFLGFQVTLDVGSLDIGHNQQSTIKNQ